MDIFHILDFDGANLLKKSHFQLCLKIFVSERMSFLAFLMNTRGFIVAEVAKRHLDFLRKGPVRGNLSLFYLDWLISPELYVYLQAQNRQEN